MSNVTVAVRVRPLSGKEQMRGAFAVLEVQDGAQINCIDPDDKMGGIDYLRLDKTKDKSYAFDHAFDHATFLSFGFAASAASVIASTEACVGLTAP